MLGGMGLPMFGMQQPMSLADLGKHHPLSITYGREHLPGTDLRLLEGMAYCLPLIQNGASHSIP